MHHPQKSKCYICTNIEWFRYNWCHGCPEEPKEIEFKPRVEYTIPEPVRTVKAYRNAPVSDESIGKAYPGQWMQARVVNEALRDIVCPLPASRLKLI